jgi:hypothetical protein
MVGDRAYISKTLQMDLFEQYKVRLRVPFRNNRHDYGKHPKKSIDKSGKWSKLSLLNSVTI